MIQPYVFETDVLNWIDGDTIKLSKLYLIEDLAIGSVKNPVIGRLIGIDTPEHKQPYATEATEYARSLVPDGSRTLVRTVLVKGKLKDSFGRYFMVIYTPDGHDVNHALLVSGLAVPYVD